MGKRKNKKKKGHGLNVHFCLFYRTRWNPSARWLPFSMQQVHIQVYLHAVMAAESGHLVKDTG